MKATKGENAQLRFAALHCMLSVYFLNKQIDWQDLKPVFFHVRENAGCKNIMLYDFTLLKNFKRKLLW